MHVEPPIRPALVGRHGRLCRTRAAALPRRRAGARPGPWWCRIASLAARAVL